VKREEEFMNCDQTFQKLTVKQRGEFSNGNEPNLMLGNDQK